MLGKLEQLANVVSPRYVKEFERVTFVRLIQFWKSAPTILVTEEISILDILPQPEKVDP